MLKKSNKSSIFGKKSFDLNLKKSVDLNQLDLNQLNPDHVIYFIFYYIVYTTIVST